MMYLITFGIIEINVNENTIIFALKPTKSYLLFMQCKLILYACYEGSTKTPNFFFIIFEFHFESLSLYFWTPIHCIVRLPVVLCLKKNV